MMMRMLDLGQKILEPKLISFNIVVDFQYNINRPVKCVTLKNKTD